MTRIDGTGNPIGDLFNQAADAVDSAKKAIQQSDVLETAQDVAANAFSEVAKLGGTASSNASTLVEAFGKAFGELAASPEKFTAVLQDALGPFFQGDLIEAIRTQALQGNTGWMPSIEFTNVAKGVFDLANNSVQLPAQFAASQLQSSLAYVDALVSFVSDSVFAGELSKPAMLGSLFGGVNNQSMISGFYGDPVGDSLEQSRRMDEALHSPEHWMDALDTVLSTGQAVGWNVWKTGEEMFHDGVEAIVLKASGRDLEASLKAGEVAFDFGQGIFDGATAILCCGVAVAQTLLGSSPPARKLTDEEIAMLREVYGDSINYEDVRVKEDVGGLLGSSGRAFTVGNTIYLPEGEEVTDSLMVHEMAHVWQFQNGGLDYMSDALISRYLGGEGYDIFAALNAGKSWEQLNPEQQAELLQVAFENGIFDEGNENSRILIKTTGGTPDQPEFDIVVVDADSAAFDALIEDGYLDATEAAKEGREQAQAGQGAT